MAIWQENDKKPTICGMKNVLLFDSSSVRQPYWLARSELSAGSIDVSASVAPYGDIDSEVFKLLSK
jgi:hypothetical protein